MATSTSSKTSRSLFQRSLSKADPLLHRLTALENERQQRRIILIPSESICLPAVRALLDSPWTNLYAEGYPPSFTTHQNEDQLADLPMQIIGYRRYSDRRFYKGTDYINLVEALARRRAAEVFATDDVPADEIFANVQALSGAAANLAIYDAFVKPGETVMGMDLMQGGHLSHGSQFHSTGKQHRIVSYGIDRKTGRLNYDHILELAKETRPKMMIGGYTSYPFAPDWSRLREIADEVGAVLMADIAHPAGMVAGGAYPSPIGKADVTVFTTHKTLMGPRGAVILTTDEDKAQAIDTAVFPGQQGGPHVNNIAGIAAVLEIAKTPAYKELQKSIVQNAATLAKALEKEELTLAYGGTDTHLMLIDLKTVRDKKQEPLLGEIAVRILEMVGVVTNKNTLPGDDVTALATGIRLGTPWITQRGITDEGLHELAAIIAHTLKAIHPFHYDGLTGTLPRGKIDWKTLEELKDRAAELAASLEGDDDNASTYPHYHFSTPVRCGCCKEGTSETTGVVHELPPQCLFRLTGPRVEAFLSNLVPADLSELLPGNTLRTYLFDNEGKLLDDVLVQRIAPRDDARDNGFYLFSNPPNVPRVTEWLRGHADGYLLFEPNDIRMKVEGPVMVENFSDFNPLGKEQATLLLVAGDQALSRLTKALEGLDEESVLLSAHEGWNVAALPESARKIVGEKLMAQGFEFDCRKTCNGLRERAGWPVWDIETPPVLDIHAVYESDPEAFALYKPYFVGQLRLKDLPAAKEALPEFVWMAEEETPKKTPLYDWHKQHSKKIIPFAGWDMPVWYTSILEEHQVVRNAAGLFDVAHMGVFGIRGPGATDFLDLVTTNYVRWFPVGQSFYSYLLDPKGDVIDDIMIYHVGHEDYLMVVNASNENEDWAWLEAVNQNLVKIDREIPARRRLREVDLRNLKDPQWGEDMRVDLAFQGKASLPVLMQLCDDPKQARALEILPRTHLTRVSLQGVDAVIARTGYSGESIGYELLIHPEKLPALWEKILEVGAPLGVAACGLGARDSLRTEAGLPLYGHELNGPQNISPAGAGFPSYVKLHKPFFIGRRAFIEREENRDMEVVRFLVDRSGEKPLHPGDTVAAKNGMVIGVVTSCVVDPRRFQVGQAYVFSRFAKEGPISVIPAAKGATKPGETEPGKRTVLPVEAEIVTRFPMRKANQEYVASEGD